MNTKISIFLLLFCCNLFLCQAQITLHTPKGNPVTYSIIQEMNAADIDSQNRHYTTNFPFATLSRKFKHDIQLSQLCMEHDGRRDGL